MKITWKALTQIMVIHPCRKQVRRNYTPGIVGMSDE
jgi:hypothetical protein